MRNKKMLSAIILSSILALELLVPHMEVAAEKSGTHEGAYGLE